MSDGHHTPEQVAKAFSYVPTMLRKLEEAGCKLPWVELHSDASGSIYLGREGEVTDEQYKLASELVKSRRPAFSQEGFIGITSCCGFVTAAEEQL